VGIYKAQPDKAYVEYALFHKKLLWDCIPAKIAQKGKLLDIGCHKGFLKELLEGEIDYFGCNIETFDKDYIKEYDLNLGVLPYPDDSFDVVCATNVLEHLYDPEPIYGEIQRVLKTDGYALISLPNDLGLASIYGTMSSWIFRRIQDYDVQKYGHHWKFSVKTARKFIGRYTGG